MTSQMWSIKHRPLLSCLTNTGARDLLQLEFYLFEMITLRIPGWLLVPSKPSQVKPLKKVEI